ncbi:hypothetical protein [Planctomicrobium sp. SH664]|uniref:hypothetical protein n=1 Tax=Planctomicrobium sp. SH664 TaxID=3448125 RepID=UPI003F5B677F
MAPKAGAKSALPILAHRYVDMWAFMGAHPTNVDLMKRLKSADTHQFNTNMDVCGTVQERDLDSGRWYESHLAALRTDVWTPNQVQQQRRLEAVQLERQEVLRRQIKASGPLNEAQTQRLHKQLLSDPVMRLSPSQFESRRLVMKLFRSNEEKVSWVGSLEEVTTREVHNSLGSKRPLLWMTANLAASKYNCDVQENHRTFRIPAIFTFCFLQHQKNKLWYVNIRRKWISIGADFVVEAEGRRIAEIDGALFGFGYNAHIYLYEAELARNREFMDLLTLFTTTVGYHNAMRKSVKRRVQAVRKGYGAQQIVEDEELGLLKNPRAA